jgi:hypothetical protein
VSWVDGAAGASHAVEHNLDAYGGIVPSVGDRVVTEWPDGYDAFEVVERYLVQGIDEHVRWHIFLLPVDLKHRTDYALHLSDEAKKLQDKYVKERRNVQLEKTMAEHKALKKHRD